MLFDNLNAVNIIACFEKLQILKLQQHFQMISLSFFQHFELMPGSFDV